MNLFIEEKYINRTENCVNGKSDIYETSSENTGELFKRLKSAHGRCSGNMYIDLKSGESKKIGWVFVKRIKYSDCKDTFLQEVWVSVHKEEPTKIIKYHYADL